MTTSISARSRTSAVADRLRIVGDHHLLGQLVASLEQPLREKRGVGVADLAAQHLIADGE